MGLIPDDIRAELLLNGAMTARGIANDPIPVVKLFTSDANATWLLAELDSRISRRRLRLVRLGARLSRTRLCLDFRATVRAGDARTADRA